MKAGRGRASASGSMGKAEAIDRSLEERGWREKEDARSRSKRETTKRRHRSVSAGARRAWFFAASPMRRSLSVNAT